MKYFIRISFNGGKPQKFYFVFFHRNVTVLYDRPPLQFHPIDLTEKHEIFMKLSENYEQFRPSAEVLKESMDALEVTKFTMKMPNGLIAENKRDTAILISSTSWTPDEDFGVLLKALAGNLNKIKFFPKSFAINFFKLITNRI